MATLTLGHRARSHDLQTRESLSEDDRLVPGINEDLGSREVNDDLPPRKPKRRLLSPYGRRRGQRHDNRDDFSPRG